MSDHENTARLSEPADAAVTVLDPRFAGMPQGGDTLPDGRFGCLDVHTGEVVTWSATAGREVFAKSSSGPIGLIFGHDGAAYLAHTGGRIGTFWVAEDAVAPCVQRLEAGSDRPATLLTEVEGTPLVAPHDICWGADGRLWLTDSHVWQWEEADRTGSGRIIALDSDGRAEVVVDTGVTFPCGIVGAPDGSIYWTESYRDRVMRRAPDGTVGVHFQLPDGHTPHGLRFAADGTLWIASFGSSTIDVVAADGATARYLGTGPGSHPMNLSFAGETLYVVDFLERDDEEMDGRLWHLEAGVAGAPTIRSAFRAPAAAFPAPSDQGA